MLTAAVAVAAAAAAAGNSDAYGLASASQARQKRITEKAGRVRSCQGRGLHWCFQSFEKGLPRNFNRSLRFKTRYSAIQKGSRATGISSEDNSTKYGASPGGHARKREPDTGLRDESGAKTVQYDGQPVLFD